MPDKASRQPGPSGAAGSTPALPAREMWGSRTGFIMAAVGSAVGLGNIWRFPYISSEGGGAAFVVLYILFTFVVGLPIALCEFGLGRSTRKSPIGALRQKGGRAWSIVGHLFVLAGFVILAYYSVIAGWATRYMVEGLLRGFPSDFQGYFASVTSGVQPVLYHVAFMVITIAIVMGGIEKGIERASTMMMPALFMILAGLALYVTTLDGAGAGYAYYLSPKLDELFHLTTIANAAGQAFFSLSLGMGAMLTFASYLPKDSNLAREGTTIAFSDFTVAFISGLVVFPVIFALGLQGSVGESTVGALFISLPGAFVEMGAIGRVVGCLFFIALFFGALTSAISLLEVVTSSVIDETGISRRAAAIATGVLIAIIGILPATSIGALGAMDAIASEVFLPLGGLLMAVFVGWFLANPREEVDIGAGPTTMKLLRGWLVILRYVVPILLVIVLTQKVPIAVQALRGLFGS